MSGQLNGSILNAFSILNLFTEARPVVTTQDVSRELNMNSVTAYRFLRSLEVVGATVSFERGHYRLGLGLVDLGQRASSADAIAGLLLPTLDKLSHELGETTIATSFSKGRIELIARAIASRPYAMHMPVGSRFEAHCTANGKLWLASLSREDLETFLNTSTLSKYTACTITQKQDLINEIEKVKRDGYAICIREREEEVSAVAVPFLLGSGKMIAGVSVFGPSSRFSKDFISQAIDKLKLEIDHLRCQLEVNPEMPK